MLLFWETLYWLSLCCLLLCWVSYWKELLCWCGVSLFLCRCNGGITPNDITKCHFAFLSLYWLTLHNVIYFASLDWVTLHKLTLYRMSFCFVSMYWLTLCPLNRVILLCVVLIDIILSDTIHNVILRCVVVLSDIHRLSFCHVPLYWVT
jgi:hypothetical protein